MKNCLFVLFLMNVSSVVFAQTDCPIIFGNDDYQEKVQAKIEKSKICQEAKELAESCGVGTSLDIQIVESALKVCNKKILKSGSVNINLFKSTTELCDKKYAHSEGSLANSAHSYCTLNVAELFDQLLQKPEL